MRRLLARVVLGVLVLTGGSASAEPGLHGLVKIASDYVYRGYSKGDGEPVLQANLDFLARSGWYAGAWVSQVDLGGAELEAISYLGLRRPLAGSVQFDLSAARYWYDADVHGRAADYEELYAALHVGERATVGLGFAPRPYGYEDPATDLQVELRHPLSDAVEVSASGGYEWAAQAYEYDNLHWNAGLTWFLSRFVALDLRYFGARELNATSHAEGPEARIADAAIEHRVVVSVSIGR